MSNCEQYFSEFGQSKSDCLNSDSQNRIVRNSDIFSLSKTRLSGIRTIFFSKPDCPDPDNNCPIKKAMAYTFTPRTPMVDCPIPNRPTDKSRVLWSPTGMDCTYQPVRFHRAKNVLLINNRFSNRQDETRSFEIQPVLDENS